MTAPLGLLVDRDRTARVDDAVDLADVRQRRQAADLVEASRARRRSRSRRRPPGASAVRAQRRNAARPSAPPSSCTVCIGTTISAEAALADLERARVGDARSRSSGAAWRARSAASRSAERSSATTRVPLRRRGAATTRPVPAPTSSTGPPCAHRELAPQRQVLAVGAALDVVPDHLGHVRVLRPRAHAKLLPAAPRATSTSRSPSIAV